MSDRGAKALVTRFATEMLIAFGPGEDTDHLTRAELRGWVQQWLDDYRAAAILGEHGLFIPDVTAHEPITGDPFDTWMQCTCGWHPDLDAETGSYFDHLSEPITESEQRLLDGNR